MKTLYAPAEKESLENIKKELSFILDIGYIEKLINSMPSMGAIINEQRQVIFANEKLLEKIELKSLKDVLGSRPGEFLNCINAMREIGGCGTSHHCSVCGLVNGILDAQKTDQKVSAECRVTTNKNESIEAYDFLVTTTPINWDNHKFYILSLSDISSEKRRKALEKIFFHDVINKTGSMNGFIDLLKMEKDQHRINQFIDYLDTINKDLTSEIISQRDLANAETGELKTVMEQNNSMETINISAAQIISHEVAAEKTLEIDVNSDTIFFMTDGALLRRVLMNMLKNALEATPRGGNVIIGCKLMKNKLRFFVKNPGVIPEKAQLQIFQRSFSTKGQNRGLGTYSMKLIGEKYLKGILGFSSDQANGTKFYIDLPIK